MSRSFAAVRWRARLLTSREYWRFTLGYRAPAPDGSWHFPPVEQVAGEGVLEAWRIDGRDFWLPSGERMPALRGVYEEVFRPSDPHYYLHKGCRINPGDVVVDAGASEGFFTAFALQMGARVLALEPSRIYADCLLKTFAEEIDQGRVQVRRALLGAQIRRVPVAVHPCGWVTDAEPGSDPRYSVEHVEESTLDALSSETGWGSVGFVKMDIEGGERSAFAGAVDTLRRYRPRLSIAVYHHPSGYFDVRDQIRDVEPTYTVEPKGAHWRGRVAIPKMLHAWSTT